MLRSTAPMMLVPTADKADVRVEPNASEVCAQLAVMLSRPEFSASARNRRFLSYVINETLQGREGRIKAYTIALAVFDRDQNFDPLIDPIVRIEASRLRRAIEHYYLTAGKNDSVRIDMPKGSYVPKFSRQNIAEVAPEEQAQQPAGAAIPADPAKNAADPAIFLRRGIGGYALVLSLVIAVLAWFLATELDWRRSFSQSAAFSQAPSILVMPFTASTGSNQDDLIAAGLTYDIISNLTRFEDLFVYGPATSFRLSDAGNAQIPDTDYLLNGVIKTRGTTLQLNIILSDRRSGRNIWALERDWRITAENIADATNSITKEVVNLLARPDGIIQEQLQKRIARKPASNLRSYECIVRFRQAWREYRHRNFTELEACLNSTIAADPAYAPAYSALALVNIDHYRFGIADPLNQDAALDEALRLAEHARELEPNASHPYLALSLAHWFKGDVEKGIQIAEQGLERNPENPELLGELGLRYALQGKWSQSEPLLNEAYKRDPAAPGSYHVGHFLYSYMRGDYEGALKQALDIDTPFVIYGYLCTVAAYGKLGKTLAAQPVIDRIRQIDPQYAVRVREDLKKRNVASHIIDEIVDGLKKAGYLPDGA